MNVRTQPAEAATSYPCRVMTEIIRALVLHPEQVRVNVLTPDAAHVILLVELPQEDIGNVIGHGGRILDALRVFLHAVAAHNDASMKLQVRPLHQP